MAVDIRLNQMIDALDGRLKSIPLEDVELSIRTFKALKDCGANTLHDAQMALVNRTLHKQYGIGRRAAKELEEIIASVCAVLPVPVPVPESKREKQLERVLEMFLSWTGALAATGSPEPDAWRELVTIRAKAEALRNN
jgi:hypothetical protein